jgi:hypothetical protein
MDAPFFSPGLWVWWPASPTHYEKEGAMPMPIAHPSSWAPMAKLARHDAGLP